MLEIPDFLLNEKYDDRYFDVIDALDEARHIHINGAFFFERLRDNFSIGETGFGAGRMLVAVMEALTDANFRGAINFSSVELYPISVDRMSHILESFRYRAATHIDKVIEAYSQINIEQSGWHDTVITLDNGAKINVRIFIGEALDMVESLDIICDAWFLDGHAPAKNPDIWRAELLSAIGRKTISGGTVTTYTVAGWVRRDLTLAGFQVEKVTGHGRKREALRGVKI